MIIFFGNCARKDYYNKWYMHELASVRVNKRRDILLDFSLETDPSIPARKLKIVFIDKKKKTFYLVDFAVLANRGVKIKECEKIYTYLDLSREQKLTVEPENKW